MSGTGLYVIQKAILARLNADATFLALCPRIYDEVPQPGVFPYVVLGDSTDLPFRVFGNGGHEETVTLHVWSKAKSFKESYDIVDRMTLVLEAGLMPVDNHSTVMVNHEQSIPLRDPDGVTRHVAVRYRVIAQDLP